MTANVKSDGKTITVTTNQGHVIGFALSELNVESTKGEITTEWAGGVPPTDLETVVRNAKAEAEAYVAQHDPTQPDAAHATKEDSKGLGGALKGAVGLP